MSYAGHDFDGTFLQSLSLDEPAERNITDELDESDDMMEIDTSFDIPKPTSSSIHAIENQTEPTEDTSLALILSPTALGARFAVKNHIDKKVQKVDKIDKNDSIDYEFDTSTFTPVKKSIDTIERFRPRNPEQFQPLHSNLSMFNSNVSLYALAVDPRQMLHQSEPKSIQVHHHYYFAPQTSQMSEREEIPKETKETTKYTETAETTDLSDLSLVRLPQPWEKEFYPHERLRYLLTTYLQLAVNAIGMAYVGYILWSIVLLVKTDVRHKLQAHTQSVLVDIASCERQYYENHCQPETIVPALEKQCSYWLKCMSQDPFNGGKTSVVSAETIGMIINSLFQPLGWKFWCVVAGMTVVGFGCNFAFGYVRAKTYYGDRDETERK